VSQTELACIAGSQDLAIGGWVCRETQPAPLVPETQPAALVPENQPAVAGSCLRPSLCWLVLQWTVGFHYKPRRRPAARALLDEAESFFIRASTSADRVSDRSCCSYVEIPDSMSIRCSWLCTPSPSPAARAQLRS
jgi:hypothetical protein